MSIPAKANHDARPSPTEALSAFLATLRYETLPEAVVLRTEELLLDWFASALAGRTGRPTQIFEEFADIMGPRNGPSEIITSRKRTSPLFAALVNGAA
ncbi:MAG: MmgE/PrpD family protein [Acidobacteria bacterium]|nr:MmgE/PrpD family protein [Acidobacteriota bacterium]